MLQNICMSGERTVALGPLVFFFYGEIRSIYQQFLIEKKSALGQIKKYVCLG